MRKHPFRSTNKTRLRRQRLHAKERALQRHELLLTTADLERIAGQIQDGHDAWFVLRVSNRLAHHVVRWNDRLLPLLYDGERHQVATFLPLYYLELPVYRRALEAVNV